MAAFTDNKGPEVWQTLRVTRIGTLEEADMCTETGAASDRRSATSTAAALYSIII
jgi:hypothetical protein